MSCSGNTQWYVCSKGDFKGCCSSDPCKTGICPDSVSESGRDAGADSSSESSTTTTTPEHKAETSTTPTTTSSSVDSITLSSSSSSTLSSTQTSTASPGSAAETGGDSTMMDMHDMNGSSMQKYHDSLIAGVITGCVVAVLLLVGIILCMWYRSRKKTGKKFTLLQWCGSCCGRKSVYGEHVRNRHNCRTNTSACTCCNASAPTGEVNPSTPVSNANANVNASIDLGSTTITPGSAGTRSIPYSPPSAISSPERQHQPYQNVAAAVSPPQPLETIPSPTLIYQQNRDKRRRQRTTHELGDTGFYRPRVELATHSQSELINVPPGERTRRHHRSPRPGPGPRPNPNPKPSTNNGPRRDRAGGQPEHIVTSDGVILAANFSRLSPGARDRDHATSFADVPLGLGFDFSSADRDIMRRAEAISEDHGQDGDVLPAYSESFNYEGKR